MCGASRKWRCYAVMLCRVVSSCAQQTNKSWHFRVIRSRLRVLIKSIKRAPDPDREPPHNYTGDGVYLTFLWGKLAQLEAQNCNKHNHGPTRPPSSRNNLNTPSFRARRLCGWLRLAVAPTVSSFRRKRDPESSFSEKPFKEAYATLYPTRHPVFGFRNGLCWGVWVFMCPPSVRFWQF